MSIIIKTKFESAVTEANSDIYTGSYIEGNSTIIEFDVRKRSYKKSLSAKSKIQWDQEYVIEIKELSTLYCPIKYRFKMARGSYYDHDGCRVFFTPDIDEVSTSQHVSKSIVRLSSFLAVKCGITLRNIALLFTLLFLVETSKSSIKRWIDEVGKNLPTDEEILKMMIGVRGANECHIDGYYPMGTNNCVMVIKDENDRILISHECKSESKDEAVKFLQKIKRYGINVTSAFSDYSKSFTQAIKEVYPHAIFQADHFHAVKNIWKHLKKAYLSFRREVKEKAAKYKSKKKKQNIEELAKQLWDLRWTILKKPENLTKEEKKKIRALEVIEQDGFVKNFRAIIKNIVSIFDKSKTEESAKAKLRKLRKKVNAEKDNNHFCKIIKFFEDHWDEALQYLKEDGVTKRASNSESGMRLLRRLEKNHDGIRSEVTRKNYIKIYQVITYLKNTNIADFIDHPLPGG